MVSLGPYAPMTKEMAMDWLKNLNTDIEYASDGEYPCLPEHNEDIPYEELFFLSADGS